LSKSNFLKLSRTVITGAPGTGKTSVIKVLEARGFYCFHEVIRDMTAKARQEEPKKEHVSNPLVFVKDPYTFNKDLLNARLAHYKQVETLEKGPYFFDRGIHDVLAYMDFFNQEYGKEFEKTCQENTYDTVFILPPWEEIYISDHERLETFEESEAIHDQLLSTYKRFGHTPINVPKTTVNERVSFILEQLNAK